jgi:DNA-binding PadR family transcriptional regulator
MSEPISDQVFHILMSLRDGPRHGYGIIQAVEARTDGAFTIGSGTLYSALKRMEATAQIRDASTTGSPEPAVKR